MKIKSTSKFRELDYHGDFYGLGDSLYKELEKPGNEVEVVTVADITTKTVGDQELRQMKTGAKWNVKTEVITSLTSGGYIEEVKAKGGK